VTYFSGCIFKKIEFTNTLIPYFYVILLAFHTIGAVQSAGLTRSGTLQAFNILLSIIKKTLRTNTTGRTYSIGQAALTIINIFLADATFKVAFRTNHIRTAQPCAIRAFAMRWVDSISLAGCTCIC